MEVVIRKGQIWKVLENPEVGKPLRHSKKGERSLRIPPSRLIYVYKGGTLFSGF
jgi:mRNA-degrading endonuclease RelE of RelBE toxin-antitoxin system